MDASLVVMGVSGCGKSSLAAAVARAAGLPLIEGDDHHSDANRQKMAQGIALTDADRAGWLAALGAELARHPGGAVLSCSALKRAYRDVLRAAVPGLRFAYLEITPAEATERVTRRARLEGHFFNATLVANQFATLESPTGEAGVLTLDATAAREALTAQVLGWMSAKESA